MMFSGKKYHSAVVEDFCAYWEAKHPRIAIMRAIEHAFPDLKSMAPPIDPYLLAKQRGAKEIVSSNIDADGYIHQLLDGTYVIQLNSDHSDERRRFTLAHELGHTLFFDVTKSHDKAISCSGKQGAEEQSTDWEEEYLCNAVASEILMPRYQFTNRLDELKPLASTIVKLAREFQTSLQSTARRMVSLSPYRLIICYWKYVENSQQYETIWIETRRSFRVKGNQFIITEDQPIFAVFKDSSDFRGRKWFSLNGPMDKYFIDGIKLSGNNGRILTVLLLDSAAETIVGNVEKAQRLEEPQQYLFE